MDPIQALLLQANKKISNFPANSRYHHTETNVLVGDNGEPITYLKRRFVPKADSFTTLQQHLVKQGERLDNITFKYLNDPELFWQVCDANEAMHPLELTEETNRILNITLPLGL